MLKTRETVYTARRFGGTVRVPGDKSIAHRALLLGSLAEGQQVIEGLPPSRDVESTARCVRKLGGAVDTLPDGRVVVFEQARPTSKISLNAGNSGTTARLLCGLAAGRGIACTIDGDESLRRRPMERVAGPLGKMGARVITSPGGTLPLSVSPRSLTGHVHRPETASAQVKSALLIAGLFATGETTVIETTPTRDHTERMLAAMGVAVESDGNAVTVSGGATPIGTTVSIPGDFSSAAVFLATAACLPGSTVHVLSTGTNPRRTTFLDVLSAMGCVVERSEERISGGEPSATLTVTGTELRAVTVDDPSVVTGMIDEFPLLAVVATCARGTTTVHGASELRRKESDRIDAMARNLRALGAHVDEFEDGFAIHGPCAMHAGRVSSYGDHRVAMAMAVAALMARGDTIIEGASDVAVSYPDFFNDLRILLR